MYLIYLLITYIGVEPKISMTLVYIIGASIGFIGNKNWTFAHKGKSFSTALRFFTVYASIYLLNFICMWVTVDRIGIPHYLVQAANILISSVLLFIAQKYWVFATRSSNGNWQGTGDSAS